MSAINSDDAELIASDSNDYGGQYASVFKVPREYEAGEYDYVAHTTSIRVNQDVTNTLRVLDADEMRQVDDGADLFELINGESVEARMHM